MKRSFSIYHTSILVCLVILAFTTSSVASSQDGLLRIHVLDVGQGEAVFIEDSNEEEEQYGITLSFEYKGGIYIAESRFVGTQTRETYLDIVKESLLTIKPLK